MEAWSSEAKAALPRTGMPGPCVEVPAPLPALHAVVEIRGPTSCLFEALGRQDFTNGNSVLCVLKMQALDAKLTKPGNDGYQQPPSLRGPDLLAYDSSQLSPRFHTHSLVLGKGSWSLGGGTAHRPLWLTCSQPRLTMDLTPGGPPPLPTDLQVAPLTEQLMWGRSRAGY